MLVRDAVGMISCGWLWVVEEGRYGHFWRRKDVLAEVARLVVHCLLPSLSMIPTLYSYHNIDKRRLSSIDYISQLHVSINCSIGLSSTAVAHSIPAPFTFDLFYPSTPIALPFLLPGPCCDHAGAPRTSLSRPRELVARSPSRQRLASLGRCPAYSFPAGPPLRRQAMMMAMEDRRLHISTSGYGKLDQEEQVKVDHPEDQRMPVLHRHRQSNLLFHLHLGKRT